MGMRRSALGRKALTVLVSTSMVVSMMPTAALADAVGANDATAEQSQVKENESGGGASEKVTDSDSVDSGTSEGAANGQATTEQGSSTQTSDDSQQGTGSQESVAAGVAEVNGKKFATLQAAINAARDGETVTLLADATEDVVISKSITLDLGGKTLTNTNSGKATISVQGGTVAVKNGSVIGGTSYYNIEVTKDSNANLTLADVTAAAGNTGSSMIDNWGTLTIASGTYTGGMNTVKSEEGSTLTINGGTFTCDFGKKWSYTAVILVYGTTTINGGEFIQKTTNTSSYAKVVMTGKVDGYAAVTKVTGGKFVNEKLSGIFFGLGKATSDNFEVSGGTFNKAVSDSYMADGYIPVKNSDGTYGVKEGKFVAEVGSTGYETFDEAIAAANASTRSVTIYLRENITVDHQLVINNVNGKAITLNLEGFTLTSTYAMNTTSSEARYALVNKSTLTVKNGTFAAGEARAIGAYGVLTLNGATVTQKLTGGHACVAFCANGKNYTIKNSTIDGAYAVCNFANNATINITGSTLTGTGNTLYHNGSNYGLKLTVKDTTITSSGSCGVYISGSTSAQSNADNQNGAGGYQKATFTGCTISGAINGVEAKYGDLTLDGCTVSTTAKDASYKQDNNGPAGSGFAVVSTDNAMNNVTPKPEGTIIIKGAGKYTGPVGLGSLKSVKETYADFADETIKVSGGTFTTEVPASYCADGFTSVKNDDGSYGVLATVAQVGEKSYTDLKEAINAADAGTTVTLLADVTDFPGIVINKNITIDFGDYTVTGKTGVVVLHVTDADVTLKGGKGGINGGSGGNNVAVCANTGANVTIDGGNYTVGGDANDNGNATVYVVDTGKVTINGGTFSSEKSYAGKYYVLNVQNSAKGSIAVNGGTFVNCDPFQGDDNLGGNFVTENNGVNRVENGDGSYSCSVSSGKAQVLDADGNSVKVYDTLAAAIAGAKAGQTIALTGDVTESVTVAKESNIALDLNGFKLTNASDHTITNNGTLTIKDSSTAKTGTVDNVTHGKGALVNNGTVTLDGGTFERSEEAGTLKPYENGGNSWYTVQNNGTMTVNDGVTVRNAGGYSSNLCNADDSHAKLIINGGTFTGGVNAVKNGSNTTLVINGGTFSNTSQYVIMNWSDATISGGDFTSGGTAPAVLFTSSYEKDKDSLKVTGGTYSGSSKMIRNYYDDSNRGNASVSGGTFSAEVPADCCAENFAPAKTTDASGNVTYGVSSEVATMEFLGGSLRMDYGDSYDKTCLRFGYHVDLPEGATLQSWSWDARFGADSTKTYTINGVNKVQDANGNGFTANLVITNIGKSYYSEIDAVRMTVVFKTKNGDVVTCTESAFNQRSVNAVANAIVKSSTATDAEKNYAKGILGQS